MKNDVKIKCEWEWQQQGDMTWSEEKDLIKIIYAMAECFNGHQIFYNMTPTAYIIWQDQAI